MSAVLDIRMNLTLLVDCVAQVSRSSSTITTEGTKMRNANLQKAGTILIAALFAAGGYLGTSTLVPQQATASSTVPCCEEPLMECSSSGDSCVSSSTLQNCSIETDAAGNEFCEEESCTLCKD